MLQLNRRFSCATTLDGLGLQPQNGLLQGDPLSVLLCNFCIQDWQNAVLGRATPSEPDTTLVRTCAYVDDRTLLTKNPQDMQVVWDRSTQWDISSGWQVNRDKTYVMTAGLQKGVASDINWGTASVVPTIQMKILGHEVAKTYSAGGKLQKHRTQSARQVARRLAQLHLTPATVQKVLATAILPKFAFGIQHRPIPKQSLVSLRTDLKRAMKIDHRANAWEILCSCVFPGHLIDPFLKAFTTHAMAILYALRQGTQELGQTWGRLWGRPQPHIPKGPVGTLKSYFSMFGVVASPDGLTWRHPSLQMVHALTTPLKKIAHFLREVGRIQHMSELERRRNHMHGITQIDREVTGALTRKEGHVHRRFLIPVISDAVWTMSRRFRAGLVQDPHCPWCPGCPETLEHLWFRCPRWSAFRSPLEPYIDRIMGEPTCVSHCFIATTNLPPALKKAWSRIQIAIATIYKERLDANPSHLRRPRDGQGGQAGPLRSLPAPPRPVGGTPLSWIYTERLQAGRVTWPFSRRAWREVSCWATHLKVVEGEGRKTSVLELYLSFMATAGGQRFLTDHPSTDNGGRISSQLTAFTHALKAFEALTHSQSILQGRIDKTQPNFLAAFGFPRFLLTVEPICHPHYEAVQEQLSRAMSEITESTQSMHASQIWRRWSPGVEHSQMHVTHITWADPLWRLPLKRRVVKSPEPLWSKGAQEVKLHWERILDTEDVVGGLGWLDDYGFCASDDFPHIRAQLRWELKKIARLEDHYKKLNDAPSHRVPLWEQGATTTLSPLWGGGVCL